MIRAVDAPAAAGATRATLVDPALAVAASPPAQTVVDVLELVNAPRLVGFAVASFLVSALAAAVYRWYVAEAVPAGLTTLLGTATVAVYLNTVGLFASVVPVGGVVTTDPFAPMTVLRNVVSLLVAAGTTPVGRRAGDHFATNVTAVAGGDRVDGELSRFARAVGRIRTVDLPEEIADIDGYDPVDEATKDRLAGETLLFPRRLSDGELHDAFLTRLKEEYGVGHVDAEFDGDEVTYLGVGRRVAGIGPTLGPGTCAVAIRADPPNGAGPGDVVQVWRLPRSGSETEEDSVDPDTVESAPEPATATAEPAAATEQTGGDEPEGHGDRAPERVATAELRAAVGDVVTLAVDESDAPEFVADGRYRLLTMPAEARADREFASILRVADETMAAVAVEETSALEGTSVGEVTGAVVAVEAMDGSVEPIPARDRTLSAGETVYVIARPEAIRDLERRGTSAAEADVDDDGTAGPNPGRRSPKGPKADDD
ncbi:TrkA C-terminal domain-containing protein [Halobaculum sp. CBA1158]|uniref:TrkA C-terminal domain-containing protein n=1 Tax=Halobaculum sp. CBA1158 TaxID=2904243 RepID=UPI001F45659B|nr:TrkA C-terminal domain-containing protein [Halobaculum sp. CBA1158]UIP01123.1 TrkA C-terminal domain-containing protein [Halobaculum sp. CBA1158]